VLLANGGVLAQGLPDHVLTDANLIDARHQVVRGSHDGVPFVLPWAPSGPTGAPAQ
jgi:hypothetical protein